MKPINGIADSRITIRGFTGNLYKQEKDPGLVASMSGHAEECYVFARYRTTDDGMEMEQVNLINEYNNKKNQLMDLYSMIEAGGHFKPELIGEDPAKFADCPVETAQETGAGEPARQPVEEVLQTTRETAEKCHAHTTTLWAWTKAKSPVPAKTSRQKSFALSGIQKILNDRGDEKRKQQL